MEFDLTKLESRKKKTDSEKRKSKRRFDFDRSRHIYFAVTK